MINIFPEIDLEEIERDLETEEDFIYNNTSFLFDFQEGDFIYKNGNPILIKEKQALSTWIEKSIRTQIYQYLIYENREQDLISFREYGSNLMRLIKGKKLPSLVIKAEAQRDVEELTNQNPYVRRIENFDIEMHPKEDRIYLAGVVFDVITTFDDNIKMEVGI